MARDILVTGALVPTMRYLSHLNVQGSENLESHKTMIFAANHVSHLDTPLVLSALPMRIRNRIAVAGAADTFFMKTCTAITTVFAFNVIPIERHKVNRRSAEIAQGLLTNGWHLLIYPEGGRTTTGYLGEFKGGVAYLSEKTGAVVVPTFIYGAGELRGPKYAKASKYVDAPNQNRHPVTVAFDTPLSLGEGENMRRFGVRIEHAVADLGRRVTGHDVYEHPKSA